MERKRNPFENQETGMIRSIDGLSMTLLNSLAFTIIHLVIGFSLNLVDVRRFYPKNRFFMPFRWEKHGYIYKKYLCINKWKRLLPDGASFFKKGFPKKRLECLTYEYFVKFIAETCRAELIHWLAICTTPLFILWNIPVGMGAVIVVMFFLNIPCILTQRYNRFRLIKLLKNRDMKK